MAFLFVSGLSSMRRGLWEKCQDYLRKINRDIAQLLTHSRSIGTAWPGSAQPWGPGAFLNWALFAFCTDQSFLQFFGDEFLRLLLTRFIFCSATMRMHKIFRVCRDVCALWELWARGCGSALAQVGGSEGWAALGDLRKVADAHMLSLQLALRLCLCVSPRHEAFALQEPQPCM